MSNEDFNIAKPESLAFRLSYDQYIAPLLLSAEFRATHYFEDFHRSRDVTRYMAGVEGRADLWADRGHRVELIGNWFYDIDRQDSSFVIGLVWHDGDRSGFRDFAPDEIGFRGLRTFRMQGALEEEDLEP